MGKGCLGVVVIVIVAALIMVVPIFATYNKIVGLDEQIKASWAEIENQLQRRSDLIPNLVNTVKGYASHEKEVFTQIADARSKLAGAKTVPEKIQAAGALDSALGRLLAIAENYPQLKANESFNRLMDELAGTENRIAVSRMRYNESIRDYNMVIRKIPGKMIAGMFGFQEQAAYFKAEEKAKETPKVEF
jgi:LemA protein